MKNWRVNIINGLFILLFTYTALSKLYAYRQFRFVLSIAPLTGKYAALLAIIVPAAELVIAILLFIPHTAKRGLIAGISLACAHIPDRRPPYFYTGKRSSTPAATQTYKQPLPALGCSVTESCMNKLKKR